MTLAKILSINSTLCLFCGLVMGLKSATVNTLIGNPYEVWMAPVGWLLVAYGIWLWAASIQARHEQLPIKALQVFIVGDYGWTLLMLALISIGEVITTPSGIRLAFITALLTAVLGALQFRQFKLLTGKL